MSSAHPTDTLYCLDLPFLIDGTCFSDTTFPRGFDSILSNTSFSWGFRTPGLSGTETSRNLDGGEDFSAFNSLTKEVGSACRGLSPGGSHGVPSPSRFHKRNVYANGFIQRSITMLVMVSKNNSKFLSFYNRPYKAQIQLVVAALGLPVFLWIDPSCNSKRSHIKLNEDEKRKTGTTRCLLLYQTPNIVVSYKFHRKEQQCYKENYRNPFRSIPFNLGSKLRQGYK